MATYDAFISYSHAKDKHIAAALQRVIQNLGKPWYKRWSLRVFRDDTSLSAAPSLLGAIERALDESRFLILLASPEAGVSPWVSKEVGYWIEHKSADTLLIALTDSELSWDTAAGDFSWSVSTPLPPLLKARIPEEPKWVDLRTFRDKKHLRRQRNRKFTNLAADFAAAIHGLPKDDLLADEIRQKKWGIKLAWFVAALLLVLAGTTAWQWKGAVAANRIVIEQRNVAQAKLDRALKILRHLADDGKLSVSVRRVLESCESVVIQGWWPDSRRVTNVDEQEPRTLRPQQAALPERFDRRRMEAGRTLDPTWQARRRETDGEHA